MFLPASLILVLNRTSLELAARDRHALEACVPGHVDDMEIVELPLGDTYVDPDWVDQDSDAEDCAKVDPEETYNTVFDTIKGPSYSHRYYHSTNRTRAEKLVAEAQAWELQYDLLADAYLRFKTQPAIVDPPPLIPIPANNPLLSSATSPSPEHHSLDDTLDAPPSMESTSSTPVSPSSAQAWFTVNLLGWHCKLISFLTVCTLLTQKDRSLS